MIGCDEDVAQPKPLKEARTLKQGPAGPLVKSSSETRKTSELAYEGKI